MRVFSSGKLDHPFPNELSIENGIGTYSLVHPNGSVDV